MAAKWKYALHIQEEVAGLFTPYREADGEHSIRVTRFRDMDVGNPIERPKRVD